MGVLKLNFDGSHFKFISKGGIEGVIWGRSGKAVRSYLGLVDSSNTNEAKVFAHLISCKLGGISAIIEGDSFWRFTRDQESLLFLEIDGLDWGGSRCFKSIRCFNLSHSKGGKLCAGQSCKEGSFSLLCDYWWVFFFFGIASILHLSGVIKFTFIKNRFFKRKNFLLI